MEDETTRPRVEPGAGRYTLRSSLRRARKLPLGPGQRLRDRRQALSEPTGMALLRSGQCLEPLGDLVEALFPSGTGEARVHLGVLVGLALHRRLQVVLGRTDRGPGHRISGLTQKVEVTERVACLTFGDRAKQGGYVRVTPPHPPFGRSTGSGDWPDSRRRTPP